MRLFKSIIPCMLGTYLAASLPAQPPYRVYSTPDRKYGCTLRNSGASTSAVCESSRADPKSSPRETFIDGGNDGLLDIFMDNGDGSSPPLAFLIDTRIPDGEKVIKMIPRINPYNGKIILLREESANPNHPDSARLQKRYLDIRTAAGVPCNDETRGRKRPEAQRH